MSDDELRLAIAKAKGYKWQANGDGISPANQDMANKLRIFFGALPLADDMDDEKINVSSLPDWPGDISAAWELVEEMGIGTAVFLEPEGWTCNQYIDGAGEICNAEKCETASIAICRAYLAWKQQGA